MFQAGIKVIVACHHDRSAFDVLALLSTGDTRVLRARVVGRVTKCTTANLCLQGLNVASRQSALDFAHDIPVEPSALT